MSNIFSGNILRLLFPYIYYRKKGERGNGTAGNKLNNCRSVYIIIYIVVIILYTEVPSIRERERGIFAAGNIPFSSTHTYIEDIHI